MRLLRLCPLGRPRRWRSSAATDFFFAYLFPSTMFIEKKTIQNHSLILWVFSFPHTCPFFCFFPPISTQSPSPGPKVEPISSSSTPVTMSTATTNAGSLSSASAAATAAAAAAATAAANARRGRKSDHDDISQEQVLRIYQEELAKMMSGASSNFNPVFNPALSGLSAISGGRASMASNVRDCSRYFLFHVLLYVAFA